MYRCIYCGNKFKDEPVVFNNSTLCSNCAKTIYGSEANMKKEENKLKNHKICKSCNENLEYISDNIIMTAKGQGLLKPGGGPLKFSLYVCPCCGEYIFFK